MEITEVRIVLKDDEKLKAFATVTLDDCFVVRGLKVIEGAGRLFVAMPSRRTPDGRFQDMAHPVSRPARELVESRVLQAYERALAEAAPRPWPGNP